MSLTSGARVGPYEVISAAGAGGMGEVYRATDTALKRTVALKVLPAAMAGDVDRLARFQREAEVLASLNHPSIAAIYGLASAEGVNALVMEFVEGPTLADRIKQGPIPFADAIEIATQVADALEAAHERGIIHRDLKPANIKVRADGVVKVLDFGLAKAMGNDAGSKDPASEETPTVTSPAMTQLGMILGTAAYMSPEQARGKPLDRRADVWAFGCVLYEMLTGKRAFSGAEITDVIAEVITRDPDLSALPATTPSNVRAVLSRCFVKDPRQRIRDIGDVKLLLLEPSSVAGSTPLAMAPARRSKLIALLASGLGILSIVLIGMVAIPNSTADDSAPKRLSITFDERHLLQKGQPQPSLAFSPDGRTIVYTTSGPEGNQLWVRDINAFTPKPIAGTGGARQAMFSPDGKWIGFIAGNTLKKVPVTLGPPVTLCPVQGASRGATWTDAGEIVFSGISSESGLWRVSENGGQPVLVAKGQWSYPSALPGGKAVIATAPNSIADQTSGDLSIVAITLVDGTVKPLFDGGTFARYVPSGHIAYLRNNAIMATTFDAATLTVGETRVAMVDDMYMDHATTSGNFAVSASGGLAYTPGHPSDFERRLIAIDPNKPGAEYETLLGERRSYTRPRMSPDGRLIAAPASAWRDRIWIIDVGRQTFSRLSSTPFSVENDVVWSPDSKFVAFRGERLNDDVEALYRVRGEGGQPAELLYASKDALAPTSWAPDNQSIVLQTRKPDGDIDLALYSFGATPAVRPLLQTQYVEQGGSISPDGQLIAYSSNQSGRTEVWVSAFPSMTSAVRVSIDGGLMPEWAKKGRRLFFRDGLAILAADFSGSTPSRPVVVGRIPAVIPGVGVDTMPDGRLLAIDGPSLGATPELRIVLNWFKELRDKVK